MPEIKVLFFGDSICVGQAVSAHRSWVVRVSEALFSWGMAKNCSVVVLNDSLNGSTTTQALERLHFVMGNRIFDVVVVQFGLNDCNYWDSGHGRPRVVPETFRSNLVEINDSFCRQGTKKVMFMTNQPTKKNKYFEIPNTSYEDSNKEYNEYIRNVSERCGGVLLDMEKILTDCNYRNGTSLLLDDGIHLSEEGHLVYSEIVPPFLRSNISEIIRGGLIAPIH